MGWVVFLFTDESKTQLLSAPPLPDAAAQQEFSIFDDQKRKKKERRRTGRRRRRAYLVRRHLESWRPWTNSGASHPCASPEARRFHREWWRLSFRRAFHNCAMHGDFVLSHIMIFRDENLYQFPLKQQTQKVATYKLLLQDPHEERHF